MEAEGAHLLKRKTYSAHTNEDKMRLFLERQLYLDRVLNSLELVVIFAEQLKEVSKTCKNVFEWNKTDKSKQLPNLNKDAFYNELEATLDAMHVQSMMRNINSILKLAKNASLEV